MFVSGVGYQISHTDNYQRRHRLLYRRYRCLLRSRRRLIPNHIPIANYGILWH